jgi:hypothetical protein
VRRTGDKNVSKGITPAGQFLTLGQLADRLDTSTHRVKYAVDQYRIAPRTRVGIVRCWSEDDLPAIRSALTRIAQNRKGRWS